MARFVCADIEAGRRLGPPVDGTRAGVASLAGVVFLAAEVGVALTGADGFGVECECECEDCLCAVLDVAGFVLGTDLTTALDVPLTLFVVDELCLTADEATFSGAELLVLTGLSDLVVVGVVDFVALDDVEGLVEDFTVLLCPFEDGTTAGCCLVAVVVGISGGDAVWLGEETAGLRSRRC